MSSSRPPQIPLPISVGEGRGTSFKRSFEQYGFDLDTTPGGESSGSGSSLSASSERDERNKRARSESRTAESSGSSTSMSDDSSISGTSSFLAPMSVEEDGLSAAHPISVDEELFATSISQNLPTIGESSPIGLQDRPRISPPPIPSTSDHLRASLERFSAFDEEISALRRTTNVPPTLPPISVLTDSPLFNLEMDENVGVSGLQVFTLGEFQTHAASNSLADTGSRESLAPRAGSTSRIRPTRESVSSSIHSSSDAWFDTESTISSGVSTRGTDYMPPRDWFDTSVPAGDESIRDDSGHGQEIPNSISNIFRLLEDEERLLNRSFPTRTHTDERQARGPSVPEIPNEHNGPSEASRRFSHADWPHRPNVRRMPTESLDRGGYVNLGRNRDILPIIDTSDFEIDFPSNTHDPYAPPRYTSSRPTDSMGTDTRNTRNPVPNQRSDWAPPRMPPMQRFGSLSHSSRLPSSNSLVSETAAEMRRTISRSHMLPTIPRHDDYPFEFSSPSEPGIPWHDRRQVSGPRRQRDTEELDTFSELRSRTRNTEPLPPSPRDVTPSQVLERYAPLPLSRRGTPGDNAHRPGAAPPNASLRRLQYGVRANSDSRAATPSSHMTSAPTSPSSSDWSDDRMRHPHRHSRPEGFEARIDRLRAFSAAGRDSDDELRSRARIRAAAADAELFQSPSPPPARGRGSPLTAEPPRLASASAYESIDLSVYHQGPFRASLQRSLDLDRIRSRLDRREFLTDPTPVSSAPARAPLPPSLPPLRFDSHADLYMDRQPRATPGPAAEHSQSSNTDTSINFPHMVREARLGRSYIPELPALPHSLAYGEHATGTADVPDVRMEEARWSSWRPRAETMSTDGHSTLHDAPRERPSPRSSFLHSSGPAPQSYPAEEDPSDSLPTAPRSSAFQAGAASRQAEVQARINSLRAQVRPPPGASGLAHGLRPASSARRGDISGDFREALDILTADGLSESTTRSLFNRYLEANEDRERTSVAGDTGEAGPRYFPSRARYTRRGRLSAENEPSENSHLPRFRPANPPAERARTASISPARGGPGSSAAVLNTARRAARARAHREQDFFMSDFPRFDIHFAHRVRRNVGDYVRDEDFDSSYESLMTLASTLGEVRPRSTPSDVIASLPTGTYQDWRTSGSDERCPICLDDYQPSDPLLKLTDCSHWLHKDCLQQWLHGANTCPVCRKRVNGRNARRAAGEEPSPRSGGSSNRHNDPDFGFSTPPWRMYE